MRVLALVSALSEGEPAAWVEALAAIITRAHTVDDPDAIETLEALTKAVADEALPYDRRKQLYVAEADKVFDAEGKLIDERIRTALSAFMAGFAQFVLEERRDRP